MAGLAVACGAFAAHGLDGYFRTKYEGMEYEKKIQTAAGPQVVERIPLHRKYLADFDTGARYQMYHGLALIALGLLPGQKNRRAVNLAGVCFVLGIIGFSVGLYLYTLMHQKWIGMTVVPLGGILFLVGWGAFARAALRKDDA
ncbi:MAG: DUF423 domain-containing protein [Planctomycetaceae bacterium]|nr:MAG: DUF423 domain-containing protein [Planctomycetaceae bacterium]